MTRGDIFFDEFLFYFLWLRSRSRAIIYIKLGFPRDSELSAPEAEKLGFSHFQALGWLKRTEREEMRWKFVGDRRFKVSCRLLVPSLLGLFYENFNIFEPRGGNWGFQKLEWMTNVVSSQVAIHLTQWRFEWHSTHFFSKHVGSWVESKQKKLQASVLA